MADTHPRQNDAYIPRFLALPPAEADLLRLHAPSLARGAARLADRFYHWLQSEPDLARHLNPRDIPRLTRQQERHYHQLLLADYDQSRRETLHRLGRRHQQVGLPIQWIGAVYTLYEDHLETEVSALRLREDDALTLRRALRKRVQLDSFWQQEGVQAAERDLIATREAFYRAVTEANRLFIEAAQAPETPFEDVLGELTETLVREMGSPLTWVGLLAPGETRVSIVAAAGEAAPMTKTPLLSVDQEIPEGRGPTGLALRSGMPQIVQNIDQDPRLAPWRDLLNAHGLGGQSVAPFRLAGGTRGAIALYTRSGEVFSPDLSGLLMRLADDLASFLDRCEQTRELLRMRRYKAALDAMQYQLIQDPSPEAVYHNLVHVLVELTDAPSATVSVYEPDSFWLRVAAAAARDEDKTAELKALKISLDVNDYPYGQMFTARVFRAGEPIVLTEPHQDADLRQAWLDSTVHQGVKAIGGWPIFQSGQTTPSAVLVVQGLEGNYFTPALCDLLGQLTASVSLALTHHAHRMRIEQLSLRDPLTELPNRAYFERTAEDAIARALRTGKRLALGILDLDRFKEWNDSLGHVSGDNLLQKVANMLRAVTRNGECVARLGGDEFGFHVSLDSDERIHQVSNRLLEAIADIDHEGGRVTGSLGWAFYPDDGTDFSTLFTRADAALYGAKDGGRNTYRLYHGDIAEEVQQRFALRKSFPHAIKTGDIEFFLQPQADCVAGKLDGVELLARWKSPEGWISPARFMPAVERDRELIRLLGCHALREATRVRQSLAEAGIPLQVAVNIGATHFLQRRFMNDVNECLGESHAEGLTIEITETAALEDLARAHHVMTSLKARGFRLSLDDFGTGHASLHYAASLPVDELKLDQHFINRFRANPRSLAVVGAAVVLGKLTERSVVAEGIETAEDGELWMRVGGRRVQGYRLSPPLPQATFLDWAKGWRPDASAPVAAFPIDDLPLLDQVFRDPAISRHTEIGTPFNDCPLTRWFTRRAPAYGALSAWSSAVAVHERIHAISDLTGFHQQGSVAEQSTVDELGQALRVLYKQIDDSLQHRHDDAANSYR